DRNRFVAAHAALRETLAAQTGIPAALLDYAIGAHGKPELVEPQPIRFNLSHSQSVALIAIEPTLAVGVDVELLRPMQDAQALANAYFTQAERQALEAVDPENRDRAFLTCWTRKEACLKATGLGLSVDTRSFEVGIRPDACEVRIPYGEEMVCVALSTVEDVQGALCALARVVGHERVPAVSARIEESELVA
ncbi:MAG: 4'-phosphopantetheinyl transferase superfamily protein, partial [Gammaproteobacteria bacterium]|nr:4'-phosphopantetheinyl transferase superfamily protein [Gammaproteobacteria bacterium]